MGPPNEKKKCYKNLFGLCKMHNSMAAHNAILKNWGVQTKYSYLSSISSLNNMRGTKLKFKLLSLIDQLCKRVWMGGGGGGLVFTIH